MGDFLKEVVGFCSHAGTLLSETEGLKSGGSSEAFDLRFLEQFESLDGTFYRLPLVNPLRQSLEGEFGPKIDQILERNASRLSGQRDIANKLDSLSLLESSEASNSRLKLIAQEIIDTPQFQNFKSQMVMKAKTAVAIQLRSGLSIQPDDLTLMSARNTSDWLTSSTTESLYDYGGSFSQSGFMFGRNYLTKVMAVLDSPNSDLASKENILKSLRQMSSVDIGQSENWDSFMTLLRRLLLEEVGLTSELLRFLAKMFNSQSHHVVMDIYSLLVDHLMELRLLNGDNFGIDDDILQKSQVNHEKFNDVLKKAKLLREFQMILPNNWFRYSEKLVEQLMKKTMEFMLECRSGAKPSLLDSLTIYALIDGSALWWKKWLHSEFARKKILKCLEENDGLTAVWGSLKIGKQKSKILESRSYYCVQLLTTAAQYQTFINHLNMTVDGFTVEILTLTMDFLLWNFKSTNSTSPSQHELLKGCISLILALMADKRIPQGIWTKVENSLMIIYGCDQLPVGEKLEILCLVEQLMKDEEERSKLLGEKFEESIVQIRGQVKFERLQLAFAYLIPLLIKMQRDGQEMMVANCLMVADFQPATYEFALILQLLSEDSLLLLIGETSRLSEKLISMLNQRLKAKDTSDIPIGIFTQIIDKIRENENLYQLAVSSELLLTTVDLSDSDICDEND